MRKKPTPVDVQEILLKVQALDLGVNLQVREDASLQQT